MGDGKRTALVIKEGLKGKSCLFAEYVFLDTHHGQFSGFKDHNPCNKVMVCGKVVNAGEEPATYFPILKQQINEGYTEDSIFNLDENSLRQNSISPGQRFQVNISRKTPGFTITKGQEMLLNTNI